MKILTAFAPSQDAKDRFFSTTPTSMGWAIAPLINEIDKGNLSGADYVKQIFDPLRVHAGVWDEFNAILEKEHPDILLLSSTYDSHFSAIRLAILARQYNPEMIIVYGGPHINEVISAHVIQTMPQVYPFNESNCPFDILIKGEGELVLVKIVEEACRLGSRDALLRYLSTEEGRTSCADVPGNFECHVRCNETITIFSHSSRLDISKLPFIPRKMFGHDLDLYGFSCFREKHADGTSVLLPSTSTMLHRGCKSFCIFCSERGGFGARSFEHIAEELDGLVRAGIKGVFFDDSTLGDHTNFDALLQLLKSFPLQYGSLNRFDALQDPQFVEKLAECGFVYQYCSIEQFDKSVLKMAAKGQETESIRRGVQNLRSCGIQLGTSLLFGLPGETKDSIDATFDYVAEVDSLGMLSCVSMSLYSYHPNTPLTLATKEGKGMHSLLQYNREPPNLGSPWDGFEEGQWFHPPWVTPDSVEYIFRSGNDCIGHKLVRNMRKNGNAL